MNETTFSDRALQTPSSHLRLRKPLHQLSVTVRGTFGSEMANANPMKCRKRQQLPGFPAEWGCGPTWGRGPGVSGRCPPVERKGQGAARSAPPARTSGDWRAESRARGPYSALPRGLSAASQHSMLCFRQSRRLLGAPWAAVRGCARPPPRAVPRHAPKTPTHLSAGCTSCV